MTVSDGCPGACLCSVFCLFELFLIHYPKRNMGWPAVVEDGLFWLSVLLLCLFSDSLYIFLCVLDSLP